MGERIAVTDSKADRIVTGETPPGSGAIATTAQRALPIVLAGLVIVADQLSKLFVESLLPLSQSWAPFAGYGHLFRISHVSNTGAAFGLFPGSGGLFTWLAVFVALILVLYNFVLPAGNLILRLALGLQIGGALGNLLDRLRLGHVTDFVDVGRWPVFNLADVAIVGGVLLLGVLLLLEPGREGQEADAAQDDDGLQAIGRRRAQGHNEQTT